MLNHLRSDWFRYGFETLAVVVGILVAFALDNWSEERKLEDITFEYIQNIKDDLVADTLNLRLMFEWGNRWEKRIADYYSYYHSGNWSVEQIADSCKRIGFAFITYIPYNNTFYDLLSSGKSGLLPDHFRLRLYTLKKRQDLLVIISEHLTQDIKYNVHELEKYWNLNNSPFFTGVATQEYTLIKENGDELYAIDDNSLLEGLKHHHNIFNWTLKYIDLFNIFGKEITNQTRELIAMIDNELSK